MESKEVQDKDRFNNICIRLGNHLLKFENVEIDPKDKKKAREELRETSEVVRTSLEAFRKLLAAEPYLNYPTDDDKKLQIYLRPCKYYPNSALDRMKKFYKFKYKHPNYSDNLTPCHEKAAFLQNLFTILPYRSKNGERILLIEAGKKWDPKTCSVTEIFRSGMIILEAALEEPKTQINGVRVIFDMNGLSLEHVWQFSPTFAKDAVDFIDNCVPLRIKGMHIVNQPFVFNMIYTLFKPFVSEKLRNRLIFHGSDFKSLHNYISPSVLPKELAGDLDIPLNEGKELHKYLSKFDAEFKEKTLYGYSKQPPKD